jgi:PAS domain S-box-containing protein
MNDAPLQGDGPDSSGGPADPLQEVLEYSFDILYRRDFHSGRYRYLSRAFERILGYSPQDVAAMAYDEVSRLIHPQDRPRHDACLRRLLDAAPALAQREAVEYRMRCKDGSYRWFRDHMTIVRDPGGEPLFVVGNNRDITELKRLEQERVQAVEQLLQVQQLEAIGTLAGGIAHDFNNLLMGIVGHLNLIQLDLPPGHPHLARIAKIEEIVVSGRQLTGQLLGYARRGKFEARSLELNQIVREMIDAFSRTRKDILIHLDLTEGQTLVLADKSQLAQVLWNLCANAADAMPDGGTLSIATRLAAQAPGGPALVILTVADNGQGMDDATRERIFEPFFTTKPRGRGTGMGLAAAYGIVKGHGGDIQVCSTPGQGTCFTVSLPALAAAVEDAAGAGSGAPRIRTVLLVDDEDFVREIGRELLEHLGFTVIEAAGGQEALALLEHSREAVDLVILDLVMPAMSGAETFDGLKRIDPTVRILLSSGYGIEGEAQVLLDRGGDGFIQKPFTIAQLRDQIERILSGPRST